jgi:hypothetical protein
MSVLTTNNTAIFLAFNFRFSGFASSFLAPITELQRYFPCSCHLSNETDNLIGFTVTCVSVRGLGEGGNELSAAIKCRKYLVWLRNC